MIRNRNLVLAATVLLALSLATSAAIADQGCRNVSSNVRFISDVFEDPGCRGYDFCQYAVVRGTLNGLWWAFWNLDGEEPVAGDTAVAFNVVDIFRTNQGDIYAEERGIVNFLAPDGYVAHIGVTGGTDRYEGATGWFSGTFQFDPVGGKLAGEICWNGD